MVARMFILSMRGAFRSIVRHSHFWAQVSGWLPDPSPEKEIVWTVVARMGEDTCCNLTAVLFLLFEEVPCRIFEVRRPVPTGP
ncbi:hypothetical protein GCM10023083_56610 [Streptomyces phyllanthi]